MRNAMWKTFCLTFVLILGLLVAGCGGGGSTGSGSVTPANKGRLSFTIKWPVHSRLIPYEAMSIVVKLSQGATTVDTVTANYTSAVGTAQTITTDAVPATATGTNYTLSAQAYPLANGAGTALAAGTLSTVVITAGQTTPITLTLGTTLDEIAVTLTQPGQTAQNATVLAAAPQTQTGALTIIPTLTTTVTVTPENASANTLTLFPLAAGSIGTSTADTVQLSSGLVPHINNLAASLLQFNTSATASGSTGFTVNYIEPNNNAITGAPSNLITAMPVAVTVSPVTTSATPTLTQPGPSTNISAIEDVTFDSTNGLTYLVHAGVNYYITSDLTANAESGTPLSVPPPSPNLLASLGGDTGFYSQVSAANLTLWSQAAGVTLSHGLQDLDSTPGYTGVVYALDVQKNVYTVNSTTATLLTTLTGSPAFISLGTDLNSSTASNRVIYWIDTSGNLHQTFTSTTAGEPVFGTSVPTGVLAVAEVENCPLTFIIVGTTLEAISQTGTVVTSISLPATNGANAVTYTHLAVNVTATGAITGAAVGQDAASNPIYVTF